MKTQGELDQEMIGRDLKVYVKAHAPNIPTGADYHILCAKSRLQDMNQASKLIDDTRSPEWYAFHHLGESLEHLIRALELIQRERQQEKQQQTKTSRANAYVDKHGDSSWEVDALPPEALRNIIEAALNEILDTDKMDEVKAQEEIEKTMLRKAVKNIRKKLGQ